MQKKIYSTLILMLLAFGAHAKKTASTNAKETAPLKIGYTNIEYILSFLPETKGIESELASYEGQLKKKLKANVEEFQKKVQAFQQGYETMTEPARNKKQQELQQQQMRIQQEEMEAQEKLASKHTNLLKPIYEKIKNKIEQVAKENGYTHVFNEYVGGMLVLLYAGEEHNISTLVLKKLGVNSDQDKKN